MKAKEDLLAFIKQFPFAVLVVAYPRLLATHIPLVLVQADNKLYLEGHVAAHNEILHSLTTTNEVLVIHQGPHAYVSSSWYEHPEVSTWDYSAVHVHTVPQSMTEAELRTSLRRLTHQHERSQPEPLYYEELPAHVIDSQIGRIRGFRFLIKSMQGIVKYHQDYSEAERECIAARLSLGDASSQAVGRLINNQ